MQQNWKFRRGDIYYVQFGNTSTGSEQHGDRPAVIIQNDVGNTYAPTLIVVPLTSNTEKKVTQPTHCLLENEGLSMSSMALAEQIFTIDKSRILKYLGHSEHPACHQLYEEGRLTSWTNAEPNAILSAVTGGATSRTIAGRSLTTE